MPRKPKIVPEEVVDPTGWMLSNALAEFVLMHTNEIKYMCMFAYTFMHGSKVFAAVPEKASTAYKFVSLCMACTGGGIIVPILVNGLPVILNTDAYPIAIIASFIVHNYFPIMREILNLSPLFKGIVIFMYETQRAFVVNKLTLAAAAAIPPSEFGFPVFGPIFCGTIGGCGGAFLPLNKGLDPIKSGLAQPMKTAFIGSTCLHLFLNTSLSDGVIDAKPKARVCLALFFIVSNLYTTLYASKSAEKKKSD